MVFSSIIDRLRKKSQDRREGFPGFPGVSVREAPVSSDAYAEARIPLFGKPEIKLSDMSSPGIVRSLGHEIFHVDQKRSNPVRYYLDRFVRKGALVDPIEQEAESFGRFYERLQETSKKRGLAAPPLSIAVTMFKRGSR